MKRRLRPPPGRGAIYEALWAVVAGCVRDAIRCHPDYFTHAGRDAAWGSLTKRIVGQLDAAVRKATGGE